MMRHFNHYQDIAEAFALYPKEREIEYLTTGLCAEAGEVADKVAKYFRGDKDKLDKQGLIKELGDVLWFVSQMSAALGTPLAYVAETNIEKLNSRKERDVIKGDGDDR